MRFFRAVKVASMLFISLGVAVLAWAIPAEEVYYGSARRYSKAAEVNAKKVFMAIPAYREIIEENIEKDSARYFLKLREANQIFRRTIAKYAKDNGFDLVCEEGNVEGAYNATDDMIELIKRRTQ